MPSPNTLTPRSLRPVGIGPQLRRWRTEQGLTQARLAANAGVSLKTIQRMERNEPFAADTAMRVEWALDLPERSIAPDWDEAPSPDAVGYGPRVRARRRALGRSLKRVATEAGMSAAALSRFERMLSRPRGAIVEWIDEFGMHADAIVWAALAEALDFLDVADLNAFCGSAEVSRWQVEEDRRSGLWHAEPRLVEDHGRSQPTSE